MGERGELNPFLWFKVAPKMCVCWIRGTKELDTKDIDTVFVCVCVVCVCGVCVCVCVCDTR